jgi:23S rRNA (uracil1939-C5)-methyltransferase
MKKNADRGSDLGPLLHSEHIVAIEKLLVGGDGLARIPYQDKRLVVFLKLAVPNEKVKIKITLIEKNHLIGEILEVIETSPLRRQPPCIYFEKCGGCTWLHITEAEQQHQKEQILTDLFKKFIPQIEYKLLPTISSEKTLGYRNRIQLKQLGSELGYFARGSHQIVDISSCAIAANEISEQIPKIKTILKPSDSIKKFELRINQLNQFEYYPIGNRGEELSFSQVNNSVNIKLVQRVTEIIQQLSPQFLTELYAGAGNFTFPLLAARPLLQIESAELNSQLTTFATKKLTELKLQKRLFAFTTDCESFVKRRVLSKELILLDPPRSGCSDDVINKIIHTNPESLLYISCHPVFLVRDIKKILSHNTDYKIESLQIFDMFPQTDHFETLVLLRRSSK